MRYGGLGGLGGLPPTRFGNPNSQQVLSDDEFTAKWQETAPPQYIGGGEPTYRNIAVDYFPDAHRPVREDPMHPVSPRPPARPGDPTGAYGAVETVELTPGTPREINPAWSEWNDRFQSALGQRQENQTRQQQAYNTMINHGADNGLLPEGYSRPGFGQISGQANAFNSDGGTQLGGVDNSWTSGAYTPEQGGNGVYNPNPYGPNSFKKNNWQL